MTILVQQVNFFNIGTPINADLREQINPTVEAKFYELLGPFVDVYNGATPNVTAAQDALQGLNDLLTNGLVAPIPSHPDGASGTFYLDAKRIEILDGIYRTLSSAGIDTGNPASITLDLLNQWKDLSVLSPIIQQLLETAVTIAETNHSLQAMIELIYVRTGNELIEDKMISLEEALTTTQGVLDSMKEIQDIHNQLEVEGRDASALGLNWESNTFNNNKIISAYSPLASIHFGSPLIPTIPVEFLTGSLLNSAGQAVAGRLLTEYNRLVNSLLPEVSGRTLPGQFEPPGSDNPVAGTLLERLRTVRDDLEAFAIAAGAEPVDIGDLTDAFKEWLIDNFDERGSAETAIAGKIQQNLTNAITSAHSLNDRQKEEVRRFLFVFEEYYKSASSILLRISQIIEKMAQKITG